MKGLKFFAGLAFALALSACNTIGVPAPKSAAQAVYEAKASFAVALTVADTYKNLPACGQPTSPPICSNADVVTKLRLVANASSATLDAAEATVRDPNFKGDTTSQIVVAATNAVGALKSITDTLKLQ